MEAKLLRPPVILVLFRAFQTRLGGGVQLQEMDETGAKVTAEEGLRKKFASWARIENYNLAWVPRWGRGVNLSSTPRQRRRFGVYMASGKPLRPFLQGCSEGQKVAVSQLLPLG